MEPWVFAAGSTAIASGAIATNAVLWGRAMKRIRSWKRDRRELGERLDWPRAHVFVCLKGHLPRLEASVKALALQDYAGPFRVTYIVEQTDEVLPAILRLVVDSSLMDVKIVDKVTNSTFRCGQKNYNLLHGIEHADEFDASSEVYAFCDGDLVVSPTWLSEMIHPLARRASDVSTSFHFVESQEKALLGALHGMAETWQSLAALVCQGATWGGSMAIRRSLFWEIGLAEVWRETVVDDITMFRVLKSRRIRVTSVPQFLVVSRSEIRSYRGFVRWLGRQFFFVKIYSPFWYMLLGAQMMLNGAALGVGTFQLTTRLVSGSWPYGAGVGIGAIAASACVFASFYFSRFLIPDRPPIRAWFGAALLVNLASLLACADATLRRRKLTWSDFTYFLARDGRVAEIVKVQGPESPTPDEAVVERAIA